MKYYIVVPYKKYLSIVARAMTIDKAKSLYHEAVEANPNKIVLIMEVLDDEEV